MTSHFDPLDRDSAVGVPRDLRDAAIACGAAIAAGTAGAYAFNAFSALEGFGWFTAFFFEQDMLWLAAIALLLCGLGLVRLSATRPSAGFGGFAPPRARLAGG